MAHDVTQAKKPRCTGTRRSVGGVGVYKALGGFASNSINLTRLESFFVNKDFKQFSFLVDVESHPDSSNFKKALKVLNLYSTKVKMIGYFEASNFRN